MYVQGMDLANRKISFSPSLCPDTGSLALLIVLQTFLPASAPLAGWVGVLI